MTHSIEEMVGAVEREAVRYASWAIAEMDDDLIARYENQQAVLAAAAKALRVWHAALTELASEDGSVVGVVAERALAPAVAGAGER